jgi:hypothetical protein
VEGYHLLWDVHERAVESNRGERVMRSGTERTSGWRTALVGVVVGCLLVTTVAGSLFVGGVAGETTGPGAPVGDVDSEVVFDSEDETDADADEEEEESDSESSSSDDERTGILRYEGFEDGEWEDQYYSVLPEPESEAGRTTTEHARAGERSMQVRVEKDWDYSGVNSVRSEIATRNRWALDSAGWSVMNEPFWVGFSFRTPAESDGQNEGLFGFHRDVSENPGNSFAYPSSAHRWRKPFSGGITGDELGISHTVWNDGGTSTEQRTATVPVERSTWNDVVAHIKWSRPGDGETGFMKVWVNGELVIDVTADNVVDRAAPRQIKFGTYKFGWENGAGGESIRDERTYWFDEIRYGSADSDYASVAPGSDAEPEDDSDEDN